MKRTLGAAAAGALIPLLLPGVVLAGANFGAMGAPGIAARIMDLLANEQYDEVLKIAAEIVDREPLEPDGYFIRATALDSRTLDFEDDLDLSAWEAACDSVIAACAAVQSDPTRRAVGHFYLGTITGYRAYHHLRSGNTLKGYLDGAAAARHLGKKFTAKNAPQEQLFK
jgi:hypothetical protein